MLEKENLFALNVNTTVLRSMGSVEDKDTDVLYYIIKHD